MRRAGEASYQIGPLTQIAPVDQLRAWHDAAAEGHVVQWASGPTLGVPGEAHRLIDEWERLGTVKRLPVERRHGTLTYRIRRTGPEAAAGSADAARLSVGARALLAALAEAAGDDGAIPCNDLLAELAGLPGKRAVQYRLAELQRAGRVRVIALERTGAAVTARRVEFL